jgi:hypothetical protein
MITLADRLAVTRNRPTGFDWMRLLLSMSIIGWHTIALSYGSHVERFYLISHLVAWIGGAGALSPTCVPGYAMRTYSGRPRSSIRFSTSTAIATSLA